MNDIRATEHAIARQFNIGIAAAVHKLDVVLWKSVARLPDDLELRDVSMRYFEEFATVLANDVLRCQHHHAVMRKEQCAQAIEDRNKK